MERRKGPCLNMQTSTEITTVLDTLAMGRPAHLSCGTEPVLRVDVQVILLMEEILHQLRLVAYPIIYRVLNTSQVVSWISEPSTVCI